MKIRSNALPAFLIITLLFFTTPIFGETEVYFSPETDILQLLLQQVNLTKDSLYAAISSIDSGELVQALIEAKKKGVKIQLIIDGESVLENPTQVKFLQEGGLEVRLLRGDAGGRMDNNFAIFDRKELLTGSYYWTERSQRFNLESVLLTDEPKVVETYLKEFDRLIGLSKETPVKKPLLRPAPLKPPSQKETEGKEFLDTSFQELDNIFGEESSLTGSQKKKVWENYRGKYVQWQGIVVYKGVGRMDWNRVGLSHNQGKEADVEVSFNSRNMEDILSLQEGDTVTYTAKLSSRKGHGAPYRLEDGELLEHK
ncbi:MAG TPA: phospholipase D-like domain-containing protein [Candidatus Hypogeohydataceae bacterium YC41]